MQVNGFSCLPGDDIFRLSSAPYQLLADAVSSFYAKNSALFANVFEELLPRATNKHAYASSGRLFSAVHRNSAGHKLFSLVDKLVQISFLKCFVLTDMSILVSKKNTALQSEHTDCAISAAFSFYRCSISVFVMLQSRTIHVFERSHLLNARYVLHCQEYTTPPTVPTIEAWIEEIGVQLKAITVKTGEILVLQQQTIHFGDLHDERQNKICLFLSMQPKSAHNAPARQLRTSEIKVGILPLNIELALHKVVGGVHRGNNRCVFYVQR